MKLINCFLVKKLTMYKAKILQNFVKCVFSCLETEADRNRSWNWKKSRNRNRSRIRNRNRKLNLSKVGITVKNSYNSATLVVSLFCFFNESIFWDFPSFPSSVAHKREL
jgi:hypothetical protein